MLSLLEIVRLPRLQREARRKLREDLTKVFRGKKPQLTQEEAYRTANVELEIIKSMKTLFALADARERFELEKEYTPALAEYLKARLSA